MNNPRAEIPESQTLEVEPGVSVGEWIYRRLREITIFEQESWAVDRVQAVTARLDPCRPGKEHLEVVIPWLHPRIAFTAPGKYIFFGRRLFELCPDEASTAFVVAHEMAHHDLGHLKIFQTWMARALQRWGAEFAVLAFRAIERRLYGPEQECDADAYALRLCIRAGYEPRKCLAFFRVMENVLLDAGDVSGVVGPDEQSDHELDPDASFLTKARIWGFQRTRGYLPVRDRRQRLLDTVEMALPAQRDV